MINKSIKNAFKRCVFGARTAFCFLGFCEFWREFFIDFALFVLGILAKFCEFFDKFLEKFTKPQKINRIFYKIHAKFMDIKNFLEI